MVSYFAVVTVFMITVLAWRGAINELTLWRCALLAPCFGLAVWVGSQLFQLGSEATFRRVALSILVVAGLAAIVG